MTGNSTSLSNVLTLPGQRWIRIGLVGLLAVLIGACGQNNSTDHRSSADQNEQQAADASDSRDGTHDDDTGKTRGRYGVLPDVSLDRVAGGKVTSEKLKGKVVIVNFWGTWCGPCRREIPHLQEMYEKWEKRGLRIVGIAVRDREESVRSFRDEYGMTYPVVMSTQKLLKKFIRQAGSMRGIPQTLIVDRKGRIQHKIVGLRSPEFLEKRVREYLE